MVLASRDGQNSLPSRVSTNEPTEPTDVGSLVGGILLDGWLVTPTGGLRFGWLVGWCIRLVCVFGDNFFVFCAN